MSEFNKKQYEVAFQYIHLCIEKEIIPDLEIVKRIDYATTENELKSIGRELASEK